MPGGRICKLCADERVMERAAQLIAAGHADQKVADQLGLFGAAGRMVVSRHRRLHIERPARALAEAASKGRTNVKDRERAVAAAQAGDAVASFLALDTITKDLREAHQRLVRNLDAAEAGRQYHAVSALSGQELRTTEIRSRLGGHGGFAAPKAGAATGVPFNLTINFSGAPPVTIEGTALRPGDPGFETPAPFAAIDAPDHAPERYRGTSTDNEDPIDHDDDV